MRLEKILKNGTFTKKLVRLISLVVMNVAYVPGSMRALKVPVPDSINRFVWDSSVFDFAFTRIRLLL